MNKDQLYFLFILIVGFIGIVYLPREMKRKMNDSELRKRLSGDMRVVRAVYLIGIFCAIALAIVAIYKVIFG